MPRRGDTFVHLSQMDIGTWDLSFSQIAERDPRGMSAADGHDKASARGNRCSRVGGDDVGGPARHLVCISKYFKLHENLYHLGFTLDNQVPRRRRERPAHPTESQPLIAPYFLLAAFSRW